MGGNYWNLTEEERLELKRQDSIKTLQSQRRRERKSLLYDTKCLVFHGVNVAKAQEKIDDIDYELRKLQEEENATKE